MKLSKDDLLLVTDKPIAPEEVISRVKGDECGAVVTFIGKVRGYSGDKQVLSLEHSAPRGEAEKILGDIASEIRGKWDVRELVFCYRTGPVATGEVTLVVAVATVRRPEAFAACQYAIDRFKEMVMAEEVLE